MPLKKKNLSRLEHRFELIYNAFLHSTDAILITDLQGNIVEINHAFTHMFGWTRKEAIGKNTNILRSAQSSDELYQEMWQAITTNGVWKGEIINQRKDGNEIPNFLTITPVYLNGEKIGYMGIQSEITEKKKIENQLRQEKEFSESLIETANNLFVGLNTQGVIIIFNKKCEEVTGYTKQEVLGKNWFDLFIPERWKAKVQETFHSIKQRNWPYRFENPLLTKNGEERIITWHNSILQDASGKVIGTISSGQDDTERKRMEDALVRSEANLKKAQELVHLGSYEMNIPTQSAEDIHWSEETFKIMGLDPTKGEPSLEEFMRHIHDDDRQRVKHEVNNAIKKAVPFNVEHSIVRPNGDIRFVQSIGEPVCDERGKVVKLVGTMLDLTERKLAQEALQESEARIRAIVETAVDGIITIDEEGNIQSFNSAAERLFQYKAEEVIGKNIHLLMPEPYRNEHQNYLSKYLQSGEKKIIGIGREIVGQRKDGTVFPLYLAVSEVYIGERKMFNGILRDMTEQVQLQKKILQTERLAIIGQMAAKVAHEIRNPLSSISLNAELLEDELNSYESVNTREGQVLLESIISEVERVTALTEEYLQFSRLPESRPVRGNLEEDIKSMIDILQPEFNQKQITFDFKFQHGELDIRFDRVQIRRVILNIVRNAIDAMPKGGKLHIRVHKMDQRAVIDIQDSGMGIPPDMIDKIYDPFFTTKDFGTGLGLAITQQVINEHGGQITCKSELGKGTTFSIELPLNNKNQGI
ncbi:MAG: PAS domain S-box protein [bacterium]